MAVAFGLKPAVYLFDLVMREIYACLRHRGFNLSFYIDDGFSAYDAREVARWREEECKALWTLLGWYFARAKDQLEPRQTGSFLGYELDSRRELIRVPARKLESLREELRAAAQELGWPGGGLTRRGAARLAGRLMSVKEAIRLAPLFTLGLYQVVREEGSWERAVQAPRQLLADLERLLRGLDEMNGVGWLPPAAGLTLKGDASDVGGGAHAVAPAATAPFSVGSTALGWELGERPLHLLVPEMRSSLSPEEVAAGLSSTLREAKALQAAIELVTSPGELRRRLAGLGLAYITDNQGLAHGCSRMYSPVREIGACYREIWMRCAEAGLHLRVEWQPRRELGWADHLSRVEDPAAVGLVAQEFRRLCQALGLAEGRRGGEAWPSWDAFADEQNRQCPHFCAAAWCRGPSGPAALVDAFCHGEALRWEPGREGEPGVRGGHPLGGRGRRRRAMVWVFGPPEATGRILQWVEKYELNAVVVHPVRPGATWWPRLQAGLPGAMPVVAWEGVT